MIYGSYNRDETSEIANAGINQMIASVKSVEHESLSKMKSLETEGMSLRNRRIPVKAEDKDLVEKKR